MNFRFLLLLILAAGLTYPAPAQTARIAHLSHSGSVETLDATADNFGWIGPPPPEFMMDSFQFVSDTSILEYGRWNNLYKKADKKQYSPVQVVTFASKLNGTDATTRADLIRAMQRNQPQNKLVKADSSRAIRKARKLQRQSAQREAQVQRKLNREKAALIVAPPSPSRHPGVGLAVAGILVFAVAGWLLSERRPAAQPKLVA